MIKSPINPDNSRSNPSKSFTSWMIDLLLLTLGVALIYGLFLGDRPLAVPDEARYAEIPREMIALHDYITPHLNFVKYFEKPPLFYWLQVGAIKLLGLNEWAVRIPNALMALLGTLLAYSTGRLLYSRRTGILASLILASSALYFIMAHLVTLDMTLATCTAAGLFCFLASLHCATQSWGQRLFCYGFYIFAALAVLTKGLVGIILPAAIIGVWILLLNDWRLLKNLYLPTGILIFLLIAVPWHVLVQLKNPEFFRFYILDQQVLRYFTLEAGRYQPFWFFLVVLILGFLPWAVFLPQALKYSFPRSWSKRHEHRDTLFLFCWASVIFIFFSLSHSKLIPYILPVFVPIAVFMGRYLAEQSEKLTLTSGIKFGYTLLPILFFTAGVGALIIGHLRHIEEILSIQHTVIAIIAIWAGGGTLAAWFARKQQPLLAFSSLFICTILVYFLVLPAMPKVDTRTIKSLALTLKAIVKPEDEVVAYENYYQDLPFYLQRRITIIDTQSELEFGMAHQDTSAWMIRSATFWPMWQSSKKVYMVTDKHSYKTLQQAGQYKFYYVTETPDNVLLMNHP